MGCFLLSFYGVKELKETQSTDHNQGPPPLMLSSTTGLQTNKINSKNNNGLVLQMFHYEPCKHPPPQPFYGPFSGTTRVTQCQKRTSGLDGARED